MPPELNEQQQGDADDAAFAAGYDAASKGMEPPAAPVEETRVEDEKPTAAEQAPADAASAPADDPLAGLPQPVRDALTKIQRLDTIEQELRTVSGRNAALQRDIEKLRKTAAAPVAPPAHEVPRAKRDQVAAELPEVAEAIDEGVAEAVERALRNSQPKQQEQPAESHDDANDPEVADLNETVPDWATKLHSSNFKLWLSRQPADFQQRVQTTSRAAVIVGALSKFEQFESTVRSRTDAATAAAQKRADRAAAAVTPQGAGARGAPKTAPTDDDAFAAGFNRVQRGLA